MSEVGGFYTNVAAVADGNWHHVALVVDRTHRKAGFYLDRTLIKETQDFTLASQVSTFDDPRKPLKIGDGWGGNTDEALQDLSIDELRITRRALDPLEFLTPGPVAAIAPTRLLVGFENNDLCIEPYPELFPTGATTVGVWSADVFRKRTWRRKDCVYFRNPNASSMHFPSSGLVAFGRNIMLERGTESQTVEFLSKSASAAEEQIAAFYDKPEVTAADAGAGIVWTIKKKANGGLKVGIDPDGSGTVRYADLGGHTLNDGEWHHVAVTFEPQNGDMRVAAYVDYEAFGTPFTLTDCRIRQGADLSNPSCFAIGPCQGYIDEVRVTPGVLDARSQMFTIIKQGLLTVFR